ncbi:MAG: aminotransferase class I/II-fold pyridoxal phosphate-dependent enzyme [Chitinophagales bacterium]|nr:aminotransferase class I/II-fold pyridoxal phosphate-dependent enzyme [Chitinophagales bacterium]MDW8428196.1 aminotransferase class I/II-fold pyridoxal phosphate-dependent enzyme [Chitinophagales bacterium]
MNETSAGAVKPPTVSRMADSLVGSEIIRMAWEINDLIKQGATIFNFTIGDFDPQIFPIPHELEERIVTALRQKHTNYPPANGIPELRRAVSFFLKQMAGITVHADDILITSGGRPAIYCIYISLLDPDDKVVFPVPSWNNNHYCHLARAVAVGVETKPENHFMPTAAELRPHLNDAAMVALCSPQNPTGTVFSEQGLRELCELILEENNRRAGVRKPLYLFYDQMYWALTYDGVRHYDPVSLYPELRPFTIYADGLSKVFAATGLRVGWAFGPRSIIEKMKSISSHIGAWAPKPEQVAAADFLQDNSAVSQFLTQFRQQLNQRLQHFYRGLMQMKDEGLPVNAIAPQAALYLTVQIDLRGRRTPEGRTLHTTADVTDYLLHQCGIALVPFYAFGASPESSWYRLSVGTCKLEEMDEALSRLRVGLSRLR